MKRYIMMTAMLGLLWVQPAHALLSGSYIDAVTKINDDTCAVSIKTSGSLLNILPLDKITLDGNLLATLASLLDLNLDHLDHILAATPSFEDLVGVDADIELDPQACLDLIAGHQLQLVGGLGGILNTLNLPVDFGDLTSILIDALGNIDLIHLVDNSVPVVNSGGDTSSVGGGDSGVGDNQGGGGDQGGGDSGVGGQGPAVGALPSSASGGCSLDPMMAGSSMNLLGWMIPVGFFMVARRRK